MHWKTRVAYITGTVDQGLLLRNEYLVRENRILRHQLRGRPRLSDGERLSPAGIDQKLRKQALEDSANIVTPAPILARHRKLVAHRVNGSTQRQAPGRPTSTRRSRPWSSAWPRRTAPGPMTGPSAPWRTWAAAAGVAAGATTNAPAATATTRTDGRATTPGWLAPGIEACEGSVTRIAIW